MLITMTRSYEDLDVLDVRIDESENTFATAVFCLDPGSVHS